MRGGEELAEKCASCGAILPEGAKLCTSCGKIVAKNTRLRTEPATQRKPAPDVQTSSRVYSHKPTPTAVLDIVEHEPEVRSRPLPQHPKPQSNKRKPSSKKNSSKKKKSKKISSRVKLIIAFAVMVAVLLILLFSLIYTLKIREAKNLTYTSDSMIKMSYSTFGEASEHFFDDAQWSCSIITGEVSVEGINKNTRYKYVFEDGKVTQVYVGDEKLTNEKEIDILVQRMFL